jgi:hypothetical protein
MYLPELDLLGSFAMKSHGFAHGLSQPIFQKFFKTYLFSID